MEANKDAALHYIELAERAILANDYERALRYLNKSESLFPTQKAKDLIERLMHTNSYSSSTNHKSTDQPSSNSNNHADHSSNPNSNGASSTTRQRSNTNTNTNSAPSNDYTPEEAQAVRKIKTCKDLYEILGVSKTASEADLKKAYRKLALQFHPDKCKAPGATDAFKAIGKAFSILSDPKKREQYDQYGHAMEPQYHRSSNGAGHSSHNYHYYDDDEDFSAEEIFNLFFGYTGGNTRSYRRRQSPFHFSTHSTGNHTQSTTHTLAQLLPYLLLFLVSILGTFLVSEPQFQLHRTGKYSHHRQTRLSNIDYYVKADFRAPKIQSELDQFESAVVDEYVSDIRHQCYREEQYKESMLWRARMMNDQNLYHQAQKQGTPSCTKLNNFVRTGRA